MNKRQRKKRQWLYIPKDMRKSFIIGEQFSRPDDFDVYDQLMGIAIVGENRLVQRVILP